MRFINILFLPCLFLAMGLTAGCESSDYTENYKALTARTATDTAATVTFEETKATPATVEAVGKVAEEIETFLANGSVASLTTGELASQITAKIPDNFKPYFAAALGYLQATNIDINGKVPENVLRLVNNAIYGVKTACLQWRDP